MALSLSEMGDKYLGEEGGIPLTDVGRNCNEIGQAIGDTTRAIPLIATIFWQAFMQSPAFPRALERAGASFLAMNNGERFILCHGMGYFPRHDLLVFDPHFPREEPSSVFPVEASPDELIDGWRAFVRAHYTAISSAFGGIILRHGQGAAVEVVQAQPFGLIVAAQPAVELIGSSAPQAQAYYPSPAWGVAASPNQSPDCTVGVIAQDLSGREGVTTALHGLQGLQAGTTKVYVNGVEGTIDSQDTNLMQDSCFIQMTGIASQQQSAGIVSAPTVPTVKGPLKGMTPRSGEAVKFEGCTSGQVTTYVRAWTPDIPWAIEDWIQNRVLTDPASSPGDSGAALIDGNDSVLGFARYVSASGAPGAVSFSGWIWAETVFKVHQLQF